MGEVFIDESSDRGSTPLISISSFLDLNVEKAIILFLFLHLRKEYFISMSNYTSADRLYEILDKLLAGGGGGNPRLALRSIFNFGDLTLAYKYLMKTIELSSTLKKMSEMLGGRIAETMETHFEKIQEALLSIDFNNSNQGFAMFSDILSNGNAMAGLKMFASYIADNNIEKDIQQEELEAILQEIDNLIQTIENSAIDARLRTSLIANLKSMEKSIQEYGFFGILAISDTIQKTTGQVVLESLQTEQTEESKSISRLILEKMRDFNTIISFGANSQALLPAIATVIPMLVNK